MGIFVIFDEVAEVVEGVGGTFTSRTSGKMFLCIIMWTTLRVSADFTKRVVNERRGLEFFLQERGVVGPDEAFVDIKLTFVVRVRQDVLDGMPGEGENGVGGFELMDGFLGLGVPDVDEAVFGGGGEEGAIWGPGEGGNVCSMGGKDALIGPVAVGDDLDICIR